MVNGQHEANHAVCTVIGDVVGSKAVPDRARLQRDLVEVLELVAQDREALPSWVQPPQPTVGDEFQAVYADPSAAARAALLIRLMLLERGIDTRYGLGWGPVTVFDATRRPFSQDGPGWWAARRAIEEAEALERVPRTSFVRSSFAVWDAAAPEAAGGAAPEGLSVLAPSVAAFLICQDGLVEQLNERGRRLVVGSLLGRTQHEMAGTESITQGAVSQHLRSSGAAAVLAAQARLTAAT